MKKIKKVIIKALNFFCSSKGMTLVEVMVAVGMAGGLSLLMMRILDMGTKGQQRIETKSSLSQLANYASLLLSGDSCTTTLVTASNINAGTFTKRLNALSTVEVSIKAILNKDTSASPIAVGKKIDKKVEIQDLTIKNCVVTTDESSFKRMRLLCRLMIKTESPKPVGKRDIPVPIVLFYNTTSTTPTLPNTIYNLKTCVRDGSESELIRNSCEATGGKYNDTSKKCELNYNSMEISTQAVVDKLREELDLKDQKLAEAMDKMNADICLYTNQPAENCTKWKDCTTVTTHEGVRVCRFRRSSCPAKWSKYKNLTQTTGGNYGGTTTGCASKTYNLSGHLWANIPQEYLTYTTGCHTRYSSRDCGKGCTETTYHADPAESVTVYATIEEIGCI